MPYCKPGPNGEVERLKLDLAKPTAAGAIKKDSLMVESPLAMNPEENNPESSPRDVRAVSLFDLASPLSLLSLFFG